MAASAERALQQLCVSVSSAGKQPTEPLLLLQKLLKKIKDTPAEPKFRHLNLGNARLEQELFCFAGSREFLAAAGFQEKGGALELPPGGGVVFIDAYNALTHRYAEQVHAGQTAAVAAEEARVTALYRAAVEGGVRGAGRAEIEALKGRPEGVEALKVLEKILTNAIRFPDNQEYRSLKLSGAGGRKLAPAMPLAELAGFVRGQDTATLARYDGDVLQRMWAMTYWALNASPMPSMGTPSGAMVNALGAALGAAVGDALGAPLEMLGRFPLTASEVDKALEMSGGGCHSLAPGQVTEDTELTISMADGLAIVGVTSEFPSEEVGRRYCVWAGSRPFDCGMATKKAFNGAMTSVADVERRAQIASKDSQANDALMRCTPLAFWGLGRGLTVQQLGEVAREDARLSQPNATTCDVNAAYVIAMAHLIRTGGDRAGAISAVVTWAKEERVRQGDGLETLEEWLQEAIGGDELPFGPKITWAKIAFTHAFRHLQRGSSYQDAMRATLAGGGDTDTNAAIVGGLVGAAVGVRGIPEFWIRAVMACDTNIGQSRPPEYHPRRLPGLVEQLCRSG